MSLNNALEVMRIAIRDCAAVASDIAEAQHYLRPDHPIQGSLKLLLEHTHQLAHDVQTIRIGMASGPA